MVTPLEPGGTFEGHRIEELLGVGGMGHVYRATRLPDGPEVALKVVNPGLSGDPAFRQRFEEDFGRFADDLQQFQKILGDDIVSWLDSRWGALLKGVYAKKKIQMFVDDEEVGTFLYDEGQRFGTLYPITEKSLAGRVKQAQPFVDHLARKRDQDKRKITS